MIRDDLMSFLTAQDLGSFALSSELPFSVSGVELYTKNPKRVYVDKEQKLVEPLVVTFDMTVNQTETTVDVYFSNDAKTLPTDYDTTRTTIESFIDTYVLPGLMSSTVESTTEYINDLIATKVQFKLVKFN
jgi:hypothetical protein